MSKFLDDFKKDYLFKKILVDEDEYNKAKNNLSKDDFESKYFKDNDATSYSKMFCKKDKIDIEFNEYMLFLASEQLKLQKKQTKYISTIKNIIVTYLILSIIGAIILLVLFN